VLTAAVEKALKDAPANLKTWKYGEVYPVSISHPVFNGLPILHGHMSVAGPGTKPQSGGIRPAFQPALHGPLGRLVYNNKTFPLAFTDAGVQATKAHELRLEPK
jgi:hypothetical protein